MCIYEHMCQKMYVLNCVTKLPVGLPGCIKNVRISLPDEYIEAESPGESELSGKNDFLGKNDFPGKNDFAWVAHLDGVTGDVAVECLRGSEQIRLGWEDQGKKKGRKREEGIEEDKEEAEIWHAHIPTGVLEHDIFQTDPRLTQKSPFSFSLGASPHPTLLPSNFLLQIYQVLFRYWIYTLSPSAVDYGFSRWDTLPDNSQYLEENLNNRQKIPKSSSQNPEQIPQNQTNIPQNQTNIPQNPQNVPQNQKNLPQNPQNVPQNQENLPQNPKGRLYLRTDYGCERGGSNERGNISNFLRRLFLCEGGGLGKVSHYSYGRAGGFCGESFFSPNNKVWDENLFGRKTSFLDVCVCVEVLGGKGGFGSQLKGQKGKGKKKAPNFEACRDLHGRRIRDAKTVERLKDWLAENKKKDELVKALGGEGASVGDQDSIPTSEILLDSSYVEAMEERVANLRPLVRAGLLRNAAQNAPIQPPESIDIDFDFLEIGGGNGGEITEKNGGEMTEKNSGKKTEKNGGGKNEGGKNEGGKIGENEAEIKIDKPYSGEGYKDVINTLYPYRNRVQKRTHVEVPKKFTNILDKPDKSNGSLSTNGNIGETGIIGTNGNIGLNTILGTNGNIGENGNLDKNGSPIGDEWQNDNCAKMIISQNPPPKNIPHPQLEVLKRPIKKEPKIAPPQILQEARKIDPKAFNSAQQLQNAHSLEAIAEKLRMLGLKCGGRPEEKAERLFLLKSNLLENLPRRLFAVRPK